MSLTLFQLGDCTYQILLCGKFTPTQKKKHLNNFLADSSTMATCTITPLKQPKFGMTSGRNLLISRLF